ncbi:Myb family transcription factor APL [Hordeum vulgare]|nr:Myb family transcription factor APL [Hordeum vulgare]
MNQANSGDARQRAKLAKYRDYKRPKVHHAMVYWITSIVVDLAEEDDEVQMMARVTVEDPSFLTVTMRKKTMRKKATTKKKRRSLRPTAARRDCRVVAARQICSTPILTLDKWLRKHNKKSTNLELANSGDYTTQDIDFQIGAPLVVPARRDADTLRYEIQVQRELCEQLEVQKKLQMRIEAQGRYLKEILEKAQENISFDANGSAGLENARSQLTNFNLDLPGLSDNGTHVYEESSEQLVKAISDDNLHDNNLDFQLYRVRSQEAKNDKCTPKTEDLLLLDLNIKEGYDLSS